MMIVRERVGLPAILALHEATIAVLDNLDSADSMHTSAGSLALMSSRPVKDSFLVGEDAARMTEAIARGARSG